MVNQEQVLGALRTLLPPILTYAAGRGWISAGSVGEIAGAIVTLTAAGWSIAAHTTTAMVAKTDALPGVQGVIMKPTVEGRAIAADIPSPTVVPAGTVAAVDVAKAT